MKKVKKRKRRKTNRKSVKKRKRRGGNTLRGSTPTRGTVRDAVAAFGREMIHDDDDDDAEACAEQVVDEIMCMIEEQGWVAVRNSLRQTPLAMIVLEIERRHLSERGQRDEKILKLSRDGETVSAIAKKTGVSSGTVYRVLKKEEKLSLIHISEPTS